MGEIAETKQGRLYETKDKPQHPTKISPLCQKKDNIDNQQSHTRERNKKRVNYYQCMKQDMTFLL